MEPTATVTGSGSLGWLSAPYRGYKYPTPWFTQLSPLSAPRVFTLGLEVKFV